MSRQRDIFHQKTLRPLTEISFSSLMPKLDGQIAQLVEQRIENPCVPGSIPGLATIDVSFHHCL